MKRWKILAIMAVFLMLVMTGVSAMPLYKIKRVDKINEYKPLISIGGSAKIIANVSANYTRISDGEAIANVAFIDLPKEIKIRQRESITFEIQCHIHDLRNKPHSSYIVRCGAPSRPFLLPIPVFKNTDSREIDMTPWGWAFPDEGVYTITLSATIIGPGAQASISREVTVRVIPIDNQTHSFDISYPNMQPVPSITNPNVQPTPSTTPSTTNSLITKLFETISEQISNANNAEQTPSTTPNHQATPYTSEEIEDNAVAKDINSTRSIFEEEETSNC